MREHLRFSLILSLICLFAGLGLSLVNKITRPRILAQLEKTEKESLHQVIPGAERFEPVTKNGQIYYYKGFDKKEELLGYAFKTKKRGYCSDILTMVGMTPTGEIISIKILEHNETPGIGSKITEVETKETVWDRLKRKSPKIKEERPWFCEKFKGKNIRNLEKEVEVISGATISSEAVIGSVKEKALEILEEIRNEE
jgi:RnfABCDGE-type electron transport complex G subunit